MPDNAAENSPILPSDVDVESLGNFEGNSPTGGGGGGVSALERDIMSFFDQSTVTYKNDWAANTVGGYTFADYDHDGWYDYLIQIDDSGARYYCGNGNWLPL
jgi:hypothetical protein